MELMMTISTLDGLRNTNRFRTSASHSYKAIRAMVTMIAVHRSNLPILGPEIYLNSTQKSGGGLSGTNAARTSPVDL